MKYFQICYDNGDTFKIIWFRAFTEELAKKEFELEYEKYTFVAIKEIKD